LLRQRRRCDQFRARFGVGTVPVVELTRRSLLASGLRPRRSQEVRVMMKSFALALCALLVAAGAVPMALAQGTSTQQSAPSAAPSVTPPANPAQDAAPKTPEAKSSDTKVDVNVKSDRSSDAGAASPRSSGEVQRTGFFGLSPTAAIIVSVAVLLVVILAIVAMTNNSGTTYIDKTDRRV